MAFVGSVGVSGSSASSWVGNRDVCAVRPAAVVAAPVRRAAVVEMRSGKSRFRAPTTPGPGRSGPDQSAQQMELPEDGTPVFTILVRSKTAKLWYPVGALRGDERSKQLVKSMQSEWGRKLYKGTLDKGVAKTCYRDIEKMLQGAFRQYPQLKKNKKNLEFGYRVKAKDMDLPTTTTLLSEDMSLNIFDWARLKLSEMGVKL